MSVSSNRNKLSLTIINDIRSQVDKFLMNYNKTLLPVNKEALEVIKADIKNRGRHMCFDYEFLPLYVSNNFVLEDPLFMNIFRHCGDIIATMTFEQLLTSSNIGVLKLFENHIDSLNPYHYEEIEELEYIYEYARYFLECIC